MTKKLLLLTVIMLLTSCALLFKQKRWAEDLPERSLFVSNYRQKTPDISQAQLNDYLFWIKCFYQGTLVYPTGWNTMTIAALKSITSPEDREIARQKLYDLGFKISIEWAQEDDVRKINSANVAVWGRALKTASSKNQQLLFIEQVEKDVQALLDGQIKSSEIVYEHYFEEDNYDDF